MQAIRRVAKPVSYVVTAGVLALSLHMPITQAALVGTESITAAAQAQQDRARIDTLLSRTEVRAALIARGVSPADVQSRLATLTDQELAQLAGQLDELPAGGDALGVAALIFIVLIILDAACATDLFPFIKKDHCRK